MSDSEPVIEEAEPEPTPPPGSEAAERTTRLADGEDDGLQIAQPEDFEVNRDDDGEVLPVKQRIPGTEQAILVKPLPPGAFNEWLPVLEGIDEDTEKQAQIMRERIVEPEAFANADAEYVENDLRGGVLGGLLKAIRNSSGYEVLRGNREQELAENASLMEHLGAEQLQEFSDLARNENRRS